MFTQRRAMLTQCANNRSVKVSTNRHFECTAIDRRLTKLNEMSKGHFENMIRL